MENGRCSESNFTTDRRYPSLALLREPLAFSADFIDELGVRGKLLPQCDRPRPGVRLGVVHGHLEIEVTVDDPKAYTRPWTVTLRQQFAADTELIDEVCAEGERFAKQRK